MGGSGQIGGWLLRVLAAKGHEAVGTCTRVSLTRASNHSTPPTWPRAAEWLRRQRADLVFYPAGFTWVDGCERDPAKARAANLEQPLNLARAAAENGARFIYFSTDYVFDGINGPYHEDSPTNPLSAYGKAKREAELALADELGDRALVVRTSWVFGPERQGKNFAYQLLRSLTAGKPMICPSDQVSSPSYGPDVASAVVSLAEQGRSGLVHVVGPEVLDRVTFARTIAESFGLNTDLVVAKPTSELTPVGGPAPAPRPLRCGLLTPRLDEWLPRAMRPLSVCLADFRAKVSDPSEPWASPLPPGVNT
ncbi:MAG: SDR family oxidoreductase [Isosphaeraceae bacterium]